jgi:hypothetical protein
MCQQLPYLLHPQQNVYARLGCRTPSECLVVSFRVASLQPLDFLLDAGSLPDSAYLIAAAATGLE